MMGASNKQRFLFDKLGSIKEGGEYKRRRLLPEGGLGFFWADDKEDIWQRG